MKKFLPYILIFFIIVQLFAPFTVGTGIKNDIEIQKNVARAENGNVITATASTTSTSVVVTVAVVWVANNVFTEQSVYVALSDSSNKIIKSIDVPLQDSPGGNNSQSGVVTFGSNDGIVPDTTYNISSYAIQANKSVADLIASGLILGVDIPTVSVTSKSTPDPLVVKTQPVGTTGLVPQGSQSTNAESGALPACSINPLWGTGTVMGCIAQGLYYVLFVPTSFVFALSGKILDFTFMYSLSDTSYRSNFVVDGWGILKDFSNIFFIFVLLYIAFGTILNLHSVKTKEMIINVIIIGLLINFSLFTTQVVIDASNILARVFYNQKTIITGVAKDANGNPISELGAFDEIKLSEAIVSKVDPQKLIIQSQNISNIPKKAGLDTGTTDYSGGISIGSFIIVVFLSTAVNVVGTIAFLSSAFIFIGRVLGLWLAMIVAPLAFFSYIVPALQDIKMVGWKKWWPDLLKMAFVAPVFAFFMYIIVGFLDKGLSIVSASATTGGSGLNFVIAIVVPFAFIMILLMKAKSIAVDMSGEIGASFAKVGSALSGAAIAVASGGAAMALGGTVGKAGSALSNSKWARGMAASDNKFAKFIGNKTIDAGEKVKESKFGLGGKSYKETQEKKIKDEIRLQQTPAEALKQDAGAKAYKAEYESAMRAEMISKQSKGEKFDELDFKTNYEKTHAPVHDAKKTEQIRMFKKADEMEKKWDGSNQQAEQIKEYKAKGKAEKTPLSPLETYKIEEAKKKAEETKKKAEETQRKAGIELTDIDTELGTLVGKHGITNVKDINKTHISSEVAVHQASLTGVEAKIAQVNAQILKDPADTKLVHKLTTQLKKKQEINGKIEKLKSLLPNKEKYESVVAAQKQTLAQQETFINQQNTILANKTKD